MGLYPTLWRTCRVVANENRLKLIWCLFENKQLCVGQLMEKVGLSRPNTSNQLRAISARGLIMSRCEKNKVIYWAEANKKIDYAPVLLEALRISYEQSVSFSSIIRHATAFTHERRIRIVRVLTGTSQSFVGLQLRTGISPPALVRHLQKLELRGFVQQSNDLYRINRPSRLFGRELLKIAEGRAKKKEPRKT
jgi:ArsR family transcriptional regulator